ncbi:GH3 auxin-responsive promoter family protein [Romeria aff. gracilis LEGE 07310]|uniref:GH3 auxin-responsive promoter family protein n=1 Tax=Vasconcelosia minhoensis LEGE 07310 TaxID=915328 RepID=A0A8J7AVB7_9CYAN|nr:GH3 auxin-responsive promoter family protein [Romeria gracilis]MBE9076227.1 GH3 auxin-responsive promoter family protein [Romeria aff. gracilis LEGE 07310]
MSHPLLSLVAIGARWQQRAFLRKLPQSIQRQEQFLRSLLSHHQSTELGQALQLAHISSIDQFRQDVPIGSYSSYQPYFERAATGAQNVVSPEPLIHLNLSSGSTGQQKLIPITQRAQRQRAYANQVAMGFAFEQVRQRRLPLGPVLATTAAQPLGQTSGGIPYGHVSGNQLRASRSLLFNRIFAQPFEALLIANSLARNYLCLLFALQNPDLAVIAANFPLIALQLCQILEKHAESLIEDLEIGEIADWIKLEPEMRRSLGRRFKPTPHRAKQLRQILRSQGRLLPRFAWPHLAFLVTAKGGPSNFYFEQFAEYFGEVPIFGGTYAASEAVFGSHWNFNTDGTLLAIESNFYEFVPADQWDISQPKTLLPHEVTVGELYRILITNYSGFYRYDVGDVVEVTGFRGNVPLIAFRYRRGGTLSAISEKTTEYHAVQVMTALQAKFSLPVEDFCITLSQEMLLPYYILNIELAGDLEAAEAAAVLQAFDQQLGVVNSSYRLKRENHDIAAPQLNVLKPGSFYQLRQNQLAAGQGDDTQVKLPHISRDRALLSETQIIWQLRL